MSVVGIAGTWLYFPRLRERSALGVAGMGDGADGILGVQRTLDEIARFEQD